MYLNGVSAAAVLRALSAEREVKERCPVISWGRSARQENIRRGGSIELSGPQQRWSAVSRNTVSLTQWKTQKMGSLFELILNF